MALLGNSQRVKAGNFAAKTPTFNKTGYENALKQLAGPAEQQVKAGKQVAAEQKKQAENDEKLRQQQELANQVFSGGGFGGFR